MSKLDDLLQEYFTHTPESDGSAWGRDTILDYEGGKAEIKALILELIGEDEVLDGEYIDSQSRQLITRLKTFDSLRAQLRRKVEEL